MNDSGWCWVGSGEWSRQWREEWAVASGVGSGGWIGQWRVLSGIPTAHLPLSTPLATVHSTRHCPLATATNFLGSFR